MDQGKARYWNINHNEVFVHEREETGGGRYCYWVLLQRSRGGAGEINTRHLSFSLFQLIEKLPDLQRVLALSSIAIDDTGALESQMGR